MPETPTPPDAPEGEAATKKSAKKSNRPGPGNLLWIGLVGVGGGGADRADGRF